MLTTSRARVCDRQKTLHAVTFPLCNSAHLKSRASFKTRARCFFFFLSINSFILLTNNTNLLTISIFHPKLTVLEKGAQQLKDLYPIEVLKIDIKFLSKKELCVSKIIDLELIKNSTKKSSSKRNTLSESSSCDFKKKKQDNTHHDSNSQQETTTDKGQDSNSQLETGDSNGV